MGRILDVLKQTQSGPPVLEASAPAQPDLDAETPADEEIPFIEVGPRRLLEGSPSVLAPRPARSTAPQAGPPEDASVIMAPLPAWPTADSTRTVSFRPLPARLAPELVAFHDPSCAASGHYRDLLPALLTAAGRCRSRPQTLLFTAAQAEAIATTVLLNVAITAARQSGQRIVVVDAHLQCPGVAARLGLGETPGLCEVLAGTTPLGEALQETPLPNLLVLSASQHVTGSGLRFVAETFRSLLHKLREQFDLILVNGPPCDERAEVLLPAAACDAVFLVLPEKDAETPWIEELLQTLPRQGVRLAGCILSDR
jgi:hypothetical protein